MLVLYVLLQFCDISRLSTTAIYSVFQQRPIPIVQRGQVCRPGRPGDVESTANNPIMKFSCKKISHRVLKCGGAPSCSKIVVDNFRLLPKNADTCSNTSFQWSYSLKNKWRYGKFRSECSPNHHLVAVQRP